MTILKSRLKFTTCFGFILSTLVTPNLYADWTFLPESRSHLYQTMGFFIDQQSMLLYLGQSYYWAAVAVNLPLIGNNDSELHPQLVFHFSGNASMYVNGGGGVFTQSLDTRVGFFYETGLSVANLRGYIGYMHESGHTVDGTDIPDLGPLNLGDNTLKLRLLRDFDRTFRVGLDVNVITLAIPPGPSSSTGEFAEYFPLGTNENANIFSPFISLGIRQHWDLSGVKTLNVQAGVLMGNHFDNKHTHEMRWVVGYYNGADPRAKYSQIEGLHTVFGYLGFMCDL